MSETDVLSEVNRIMMGLTLLFMAHYKWRGAKRSLIIAITCLTTSIVVTIFSELGFQNVSRDSSLNTALRVSMIGIYMIAGWVCLNLTYSRAWGANRRNEGGERS